MGALLPKHTVVATVVPDFAVLRWFGLILKRGAERQALGVLAQYHGTEPSFAVVGTTCSTAVHPEFAVLWDLRCSNCIVGLRLKYGDFGHWTRFAIFGLNEKWSVGRRSGR